MEFLTNQINVYSKLHGIENKNIELLSKQLQQITIRSLSIFLYVNHSF